MCECNRCKQLSKKRQTLLQKFKNKTYTIIERDNFDFEFRLQKIINLFHKICRKERIILVYCMYFYINENWNNITDKDFKIIAIRNVNKFYKQILENGDIDDKTSKIFQEIQSKWRKLMGNNIRASL
jgi:hypothetical protein